MDWLGSGCTGGPKCQCEACEPHDGKILTSSRVLILTGPDFVVVYKPALCWRIGSSITSLVKR